MSIINVMWSGGSPYASVHKVHQQILSQAAPGACIKTWLLQDKATACLRDVGEVRAWQLSSKVLKGRGIRALSGFWLRRGFHKALLADDARVVLIDGVGVARVLLPVLRTLPHVRAVVMFHGATRLNDKEINLLRDFPPEQLTLCAVSQTLAASIEADTRLPVVTLRCALDPQAFQSQLLSREQAREQLGIALDQAQVFGAVGRLVAGKGFDCLIRAFARTLQQAPDRLLVIVGEGPARAELEARIQSLGLQGKVLLPGHLIGVASLYRAFDWVLIPSQEEGLGLIVQEAVIAHVPVLVSDLPVFEEQLGESGRYVPVDDEAAWVQAIEATAVVSAWDVAARQYAAIAPEQAWQHFSHACSVVLSGR
ncbi:MAG: glycosyltransferase [Pseudomonas taetrolens]|uniref:glycosyltransferase n=1 Tax=Pseudomonas taetrolens TaxID=47884 RepID=UPI003F9D6B85